MKNTETILWEKGTFQRVVRHKRLWKGLSFGVIHDRGYLVTVQFNCLNNTWCIVRTLRKRMLTITVE